MPHSHPPLALLVMDQSPAGEVGRLPRQLGDLVMEAQLLPGPQHRGPYPVTFT
jgi:hypothetical protein